ncbi:LIVCS family branched-chain amino acid:cation transporter [Lysinibacillus composti]|uniref:Branched-chain amino acid transport system carrier protein n=1 Tax=Lysinibacillus composti TaxID=720633 RepID=A0A3N9USG0_9BACI|nr:branched-chain amino acid transport system II carrier protein [Lysinibacillus composti]MBM7607992.1 LIVCS family branched-chain amino acid:cation transporter [Lysinibacillus composti]RQW75452.1 branched-chain amino acid transport system II carrier protein [Lysinibacillus composti]
MKFIKENLAVGFMLFALFLGAGNIIFPPLLGQQAGDEILPAIIGFLITGVGLPLLGIIAVAKNGGDLQVVANRIHPVFSIIFTSVVYLSIGPLFAIPRTAAVTYEIGIAPYLSEASQASWLPLFISTAIFFGIALYLALNPSKLVDRVGKVLTPALLIVIALLAIKSFITPMGPVGESHGAYVENAFSKGFIEGYLTMDVLASLVFGIVIVQALQAKGIVSRTKQVTITIFAGFVAACGLAFVYVSLSYIGATSTSAIGSFDDGGSIIAESAKMLYGSLGSIILSAVIILACITTAVGLISANATFFNKLFPNLPYKFLAVVFTLFSLMFANFGLSNLISISLPVLLFIYPIAIVLMFLVLFDQAFGRDPIVYTLALIATALVSLYDGIKGAGLTIDWYANILNTLPLYEQNLGWLVPAIVGLVIGWIIHILKKASA